MPVKSCAYVIKSRKLLRPGYGPTTPNEGSVCRVAIHHVLGDGSLVAANNECSIGERQINIGSAENAFDDTIERCVETMKPGEMCEIHMTRDARKEKERNTFHRSYQRVSDHTGREYRETSVDINEDANNSSLLTQSDQCKRDCGHERTNCCGEDAKTVSNTTPDIVETSVHSGSVETADVVGSEGAGGVRDSVLHISLLDVTRATDVWKLSSEEKLTRAQEYKSVGAHLYRQGSTEWAFRKFSRALKYLLLVDDDGLSTDGRSLARQLRCQCYLNLAACQLKHANSPAVIANCTRGLALESNNVKGLFRRAQAYVMQNEHDAACDDLKTALAMEPNNGAVVTLLRKVKVSLQKENALMAAALANIASGVL